MWRFLHNCIAHPLLFFTCDAKWSVRFHDYSSEKMHKQYPKLYEKVNKDDDKYLIERLESVIELMETNKHMAAARLLSVISLLKGQIKEIRE